MHFADLVRSFLPLRNPIGFGASDFIELILAALLIALVLIGRPFVEPLARRLSKSTVWCMLLLAAVPVALRLALLPHHPVPSPDVYDEFGHLLVADTLRHFRFANPAHALPQFFETFFVLQQPAYSSIYPVGQGLMLALGRAVFGLPWAGVLLSTAAFCALCYWMLRAWTSPAWALFGGVLAVFQFGPLCQWTNSYWGGGLSACAGCLVFGSLPRLRETARLRDAALLGLGLGLHLLTRPYEFIFLLASAALFLRARPIVKLLPAVAILLAAVAISLLHNKQVTGSWTTLPYSLSQYQYGVPAAFTFQADPVPHRELTPQQQLEYKMQLAFGPNGPETAATFLTRLAYRARFCRFFLLPPLYFALPFFLLALRQRRFAWAGFTLLLFALGANFYPFFEPHYIAALASFFILAGITGLQQLSRWTIHGWPAGAGAARIIIFFCFIHFMFWYGFHWFDTSGPSTALRRYETWDAINHANPARRIEVNRQLARIPGRLLVFVRYWPSHIFQDEWVYNAADIDASRVVFARDLGAQNEELVRYYPDRAVWLLEPDAAPPRLSHYQPEPAPAPKPKQQLPALRFEQVR